MKKENCVERLKQTTKKKKKKFNIKDFNDFLFTYGNAVEVQLSCRRRETRAKDKKCFIGEKYNWKNLSYQKIVVL